FFQAEDGIRDFHVTGVQTCALPIYRQRSEWRKRSIKAQRLILDWGGASAAKYRFFSTRLKRNLCQTVFWTWLNDCRRPCPTSWKAGTDRQSTCVEMMLSTRTRPSRTALCPSAENRPLSSRMTV